MSSVEKYKKRIVSWLSQRLGAVIIIAVIGGLVPAFGFVSIAVSQENAKVEAIDYNQFGRLILKFSDSFELPAYQINSDNGVLIVAFDRPIDFTLPDIAEKLPKFIVASKVDPDKKAVRFALKGDFKISKTEAGERLYIDIIPSDWSGPLPALPTDVVEELSARAKNALLLAEQRRKAQYILENQPTAIMRIGRHPTFIRLQIEWSIDVEGEFEFKKNVAELSFNWPIKIDLSDLKANLPDEIINISEDISENGNIISLKVKDNIIPRFYANSKREYIVDIDLEGQGANGLDLAELLSDDVEKLPGQDDANDKEINLAFENSQDNSSNKKKIKITPMVEQVGSTIRMTFPFEDETAAAVFRRANTLWLVFDSSATIEQPEKSSELSSVADSFSVVGAGGVSIIRIDLRTDRLATLGSEGRAWVLSLGDLVLDSVELVSLTRRQTAQGIFEVVADLKRPAKVHQLRDPKVGDILEVVTAFPPARGIARDLSLVEFSALRSVHGLVIKPLHDDILVEIKDSDVIISSNKGLIVSASKGARANKEAIEKSADRAGYINLLPLIEKEPNNFFEQEKEIMQNISASERNMLGVLRLQLAQYYLANEFFYEALGVLNLIDKNDVFGDLGLSISITRAAALTFILRSREALTILHKKEVNNVVDAMVWRAIANAKEGEFVKAKNDVLAAEPIIDTYPKWVRVNFFLAGSEAAIELGDFPLAARLIANVETSDISTQKVNEYKILLARIDAGEGRYDKALDGLGQVIAVDNRPTRASAIYYTMIFLKHMGKLDPQKASKTLAAESVIWRNNDLEVKMLGLLGNMYFEANAYREGFNAAKQLIKASPNSEAAKSLMQTSQKVFADLFLNGEVESLAPIQALSLYYDFRYLTPVGARGDEMIRNLARSLVKVDLLEQASELLQYQVDERLNGVAKAQIATDLAVIYLANKSPEKAIKVLQETNLAGIPLSLKRQRRLLEGRALIEVGREDLALDILSTFDGKDVDLLRVEAHWQAKRYDEAAEIIEGIYDSVKNKQNLSLNARKNLIKAAVGFVLAQDQIGLTRLRLKYGDAMSKTSEWGVFDFVSSKVDASSLEFKKVAQEIASLDSLKLFLKAYNENYGDSGLLNLIENNN